MNYQANKLNIRTKKVDFLLNLKKWFETPDF